MAKLQDIINGINFLRSKDGELYANTKDLKEEDFITSVAYTLEGNRVFTIKEYCPKVFHALRASFGIDPASFLASWVLPPEDKLKMAESTGRSGSLFYRTPDKRYFFKTIQPAEVACMLNMLEGYYQYLTTHKSSMMMRILGLLRIVFNTTKTYVILFQNSLPDPYVTIEEKYDLKGRMPKPGKSVDERQPVSTDALKDNEIARKFALDEKDLRHYWKILGNDVRFLRSQNVMDYSLLVGIHRVTDEDVKCHKALVKAGKSKERPTAGRKNKKLKDEDKSVFDWGGLRGRNPKTGQREVYFFAIIDCLTSYILKKKLANAFKRFRWKNSTLSTVNSRYYAKRFFTYMTMTLVQKPEGMEDDPTEVSSLQFSASEESEGSFGRKKRTTFGRSRRVTVSGDMGPIGLKDYTNGNLTAREKSSERMFGEEKKRTRRNSMGDGETISPDRTREARKRRYEEKKAAKRRKEKKNAESASKKEKLTIEKNLYYCSLEAIDELDSKEEEE